jgi:competence protein ComEC
MRAARRSDSRVVPVARGSCLRAGDTRLEVLWPPTGDVPGPENERSLVVRLCQPEGVFLITSDIGTKTEYRLSRLSSLACDVLIAPHHGSRASSSSVLISAAHPTQILIPAGPRNIHGHPHSEVLERYRLRGIPFRYPARDGACGAVFREGKWQAYP